MAYKFVTREDVQKQFKDIAHVTDGVRGSAIIIGLAAHMRHLCEHAIAERDAYREVARTSRKTIHELEIKFLGLRCKCIDPRDHADAEAAALLEKPGGL